MPRIEYTPKIKQELKTLNPSPGLEEVLEFVEEARLAIERCSTKDDLKTYLNEATAIAESKCRRVFSDNFDRNYYRIFAVLTEFVGQQSQKIP